MLFDYEKSDGSGTTRVQVDPHALEGNARLDYALARLLGPIPTGIQPLKLSPHIVKPRAQLLMVHHPAGQTKKMTRFNCLAAKSTKQQGPFLRHVCESLPGSSGGILFDMQIGAVGLHHSGGLDKNDPDSFNKGTLLARLVTVSKRLELIARHQALPLSIAHKSAPQKPASNTQSTSNTINNMLESTTQKSKDHSDQINDILNRP